MITVAITGLELFARKLAEDLEKYADGIRPEYVPLRLLPKPQDIAKIFKADIIHFIGGGAYATKHLARALLLKALSTKKILVFHWVGSDILRLKNHLKQGRLLTEVLSLEKNVHHLCEVFWTKEELGKLGIKANVIPSIGVNAHDTIAWPDNFSILTYVGKNREKFYGLDELIHLASNFPDIPITVVGTDCKSCGNKRKFPGNIKFLGWIDNIHKVMQQHPIYIRFVKHDGLSISVLEALSLGRHVCYNFNLSGCYYTPNIEKLTKIVKDLYELFKRGNLKPNIKGRKFVLRNYSKQVVIEQIKSFYFHAMES